MNRKPSFTFPPREQILWENAEWEWNLFKSFLPAVDIVLEPFVDAATFPLRFPC